MGAKNKRGFGLHCTAGFGNVQSIERFWRQTLKWKSKGYAVIIALDGTIYWLHNNTALNGYSKNYSDACWGFTTNGIRGFNAKFVHIAAIGGVEEINGKFVSKDTRTPEQIASLHYVLQKGLKYFKSIGVDITNNWSTNGHREFSPDKNGDGIISKWERIKECPSWPVIGSQFHYLYSSKDRYDKLPYIK